MATDTRFGWRPTWRVPPGEILAEILEERGISQTDLAKRMDRPVKTINEIVNGRAALTPETALQLELALGTSATVWTGLEARYREQLARETVHQELASQSGWLKLFPVAALVRLGVVPQALKPEEKLAGLLTFFGVSSPAAWEREWSPRLAALRDSPAFPTKPHALASWLRLGELASEHIESHDYDAPSFRKVVHEARSLTMHSPPSAAVRRVQQMSREAGVVVVLVPELPGVHVSGAARWLKRNRPMIQLSLRHRTDDQFWFTFFHESAHILLSTKKDFVDLVHGADGAEELKADAFARDTLLPNGDLALFVSKGEFNAESIRAFAARMGVSTGVVVGRLEHDRHVRQGALSHLKIPYRWAHE